MAITAYCVHERKDNVEVVDPKITETKNKRRLLKGKCKSCGKTITKFVGKDFKL